MYKEGAAKIRESAKAFLNPLGKASRDLSVAYVTLIAKKGDTLLDATAATGIRGIRYALESKIKKPFLLEINPIAYKAMRSNLLLNKVKANPANKSIQEFSNTYGGRFNFIDLDPFGGITPYIFDLMKITSGGGSLMVTATDTAVLCGADSKACMRLYDAKPIHNELCHEGGIRTMIGYVARIAGQFGVGISVDLSISYMHYMRVFIRLNLGPQAAYQSLSKMGYLRYCSCGKDWKVESSFLPTNLKCESCGAIMPAYGRMWTGEIKNQPIVDSLYGEIKDDEEKTEAAKLLGEIKDELSAPFYYHIPTLTKRLKIGAVSPYAVIKSLEQLGHMASFTHMKDSAIKTNASLNEVFLSIKDKK